MLAIFSSVFNFGTNTHKFASPWAFFVPPTIPLPSIRSTYRFQGWIPNLPFDQDFSQSSENPRSIGVRQRYFIRIFPIYTPNNLLNLNQNTKQIADLFCFGPQCFLWPPVTNYMLYSTLLCKKIAQIYSVLDPSLVVLYFFRPLGERAIIFYILTC